ncbi:MAG: GNAT family N-acetyltransferase [Lachnospiraceae bacterium]|nr:GNAT family N-acetyltransferase [Lachnospiraceae bacterium]
MIIVKIIDKTHEADINIKNEPFCLFGRMLVSYNNGAWSYTTERFDTVEEMCFPDENYNYDELAKNSVFVGAYDGDKCIGLAILQQAMMKYMYLYDLKVNKDYRGKHIGAMLIENSKEIAVKQGYRGLYTQGQDNNLGACLFYIRNGFTIGGLDTHVYKGTKQEGKADILFYLDAED